MSKFSWTIIFVLFSVFISTECNDTNINGTPPEEHHIYFSAYYFHAKRISLNKKSEWLKSHSEDGEIRCPGYKEKVEKADKEFDQCVTRTFEEYNHETICYMTEIFLQNCTTELANAMEGCLPEHSRQIAVLGFKSMYAITEYFCTVTGETLLELANPCLWKDLESAHKSKLSHCDEKIKEIGRRYQHNSNITTRNICSDFKSFRSCAETRVKTTCENPKTRRAFMGLYDATMSPCDKLQHV